MSVAEQEPEVGEPAPAGLSAYSKVDAIHKIKEILAYERTQSLVDRSRTGGEYDPIEQEARLRGLAESLINEYNNGQVARDSDGLAS